MPSNNLTVARFVALKANVGPDEIEAVSMSRAGSVCWLLPARRRRSSRACIRKSWRRSRPRTMCNGWSHRRFARWVRGADPQRHGSLGWHRAQRWRTPRL